MFVSYPNREKIKGIVNWGFVKDFVSVEFYIENFIFGDRWLQAAEAASSSTTGTPVEPIEAVVKESGGCESQEQEVRSSDPSKKDSDACDEVPGVDVPEKSPVVQVEGQPLVSPMSLGGIEVT